MTRKAQVERFVHGAGLPRGLLLTLVAGAFFAGLAAPARSTASDSSTARGNVTTDPGGDRRFEAVRSLLRDGRYFAAESTSRVLVDEARSAPGADSVSFARAADVLVESSWRLGRGNRGEIRDLAAAAVRIKERTLGASAPELAVSLGNLAAVHFTTSEIRSARPLYRRALLIRQQALGDESPLTATLMASYARTVADSSQITALPLYERAVQICRRVLPPDDPDLARVISQLAWIHRVMGNLQESRPLFEEALKLQERILPARHPDLAYTLYHYGYLLVMSGDRLEAKAACERSLAIREASLGPDHPDFAWSLNDIANILTYQGDFSTATRYLERALAIFERNTGNNAGSASTARMNLAKVYLFRADFTESRRLYDQALAAKERAFGREHPEVTQVLSSYAGMLVNSGDVEGAKTLLERAWSICRQALLPTDPRSLNVEMTLAVAVGALGDHARADTLFRHAIAVREQAQGRDATGLSTPLTNFGIDRYVAGDYEGARRLLLRSDSIAVKQGVYGDYNAGFTGLLVGHIEFALGHLGESERHLRSAIDAWTRFYGDQQQDVASARVSLGEVLWERGDRTRALEAALVAEAALREHVRLTMRGLSERQALGYATSLGGGRDLALAVGADGLGPSDARRVWDAVIRGRALVLDEVAERHRRAADVSRQALALASASERLANLTVRGPGNDDPDLYRQMLDQAREQRERAERALSESSGEFRRERAQRDAGAAEVIDALPDQSAIVSYVSFVRRARRPGALASISEGRGPPPESLFTATPSYIAFVLRRGETEPGVVPLGSGAAVDSLVAHWSFQVSRGARVKSRWLKEESYRPAGEALRAAVWDPVAHHLRGIERVYIVADGALNLVNFGTLPVDDSRYLIETGPSLHLLSAERDLIRREEGVSGSGLLAIGGPDFDRAAETRDEPMADASVTSSSGSAPSLRGRLSHCGDLANQRWDPLPGTLTEARAVTDLWITSGAAEAAGTRKNSFLLTGARADETSFKRLAPHRRVLHVATHGFFAGAACASPSSLPRILSSNLSGNAMPAAENPLLLCGLTLAGANHHGGSGAAGDDGILTAEEVSALDLGGVEWAVLSACETGVGQVRAGEGVFGLRRAFQVAGAHTVIMSLWAVEDQATLKWMEALYAARLRQHRSTAESVREASLAVLRERRARHENTHPFYWGAFVAAGDWR